MGSTNKTTGSTVQNKSMPFMDDVLGSAKTVFNSGNAWAPDTSSHVTPFAKQTTAGLTGLQNFATGQVIPLAQQNLGRVQSAVAGLGSNGLTDLQDQQVNRLQPIASGNGMNAEQQHAYDLLNPIASGQDRQNNPYLEDVIKRSGQDIAGANALTASGAGRYGSGMAQDVTERNIGDMSSNLRFNDYNNQQGRMDNAINQLFGMGTTGMGQKTDAIGSLYNAGQQGLGNIEGGTAALNDAFAQRADPYKTMLGIGQQYQDQNQKVINDKARIFGETQNAQTAPIDYLASLAQKFQGGSTVQNTSQPNNMMQNVIGGAIGGYGQAQNPLMGLLGGIGGLF